MEEYLKKSDVLDLIFKGEENQGVNYWFDDETTLHGKIEQMPGEIECITCGSVKGCTCMDRYKNIKRAEKTIEIAKVIEMIDDLMPEYSGLDGYHQTYLSGYWKGLNALKEKLQPKQTCKECGREL